MYIYIYVYLCLLYLYISRYLDIHIGIHIHIHIDILDCLPLGIVKCREGGCVHLIQKFLRHISII